MLRFNFKLIFNELLLGILFSKLIDVIYLYTVLVLSVCLEGIPMFSEITLCSVIKGKLIGDLDKILNIVVSTKSRYDQYSILGMLSVE